MRNKARIKLEVAYAQDEPVSIWAKGHILAQVFASLLQTEDFFGEERRTDMESLILEDFDEMEDKVEHGYWRNEPDPDPDHDRCYLYRPCRWYAIGAYPVTYVRL